MNLLKAKLVKLYTTRLASGTIDVQTPHIFQEEQMSLFHLIKRRTRREQRTILQVKDLSGGMQTSTKGIMDTFNAYVIQKYGPIQVDDCVRRMAEAEHRLLSEDWKERLDMPLTTDELHHTLTKGGGNKAPGRDGIGADFFKVTWEALKEDMLEIFSTMFFERKATEQQKLGVILCMLKTAKP